MEVVATSLPLVSVPSSADLSAVSQSVPEMVSAVVEALVKTAVEDAKSEKGDPSSHSGVVVALGGLPAATRHGSQLAEDALDEILEQL